MAVSIDWKTFVIYVPKDDLTLVQSSPTEIREMDLNWFRLELKALEAGAPGMPFTKTHEHFPEVQLGGLTFARVIEILDPYTVTFEDGQYAVNLVGANSNVGDVVNVNQVSVRSNNSAGLISTPLIEFASFENGVWIDTINGTSGTLFPIGTRLSPVNNFSDAKEIAEYRGFKRLYLLENTTLDETIDLTNYIFEGKKEIDQTLVIGNAPNVHHSMYKNLTVQGNLDGGNEILACVITDLSYISGFIMNCGLKGTISLDGNEDAVIVNSFTINPFDEPTIDVGGSGQNCSVPNYSGNLKIINMDSDTNMVAVGLNAGKVILDSSSVIRGKIYISGVGDLVDENENEIRTGIWNGNVEVTNDLVSGEDIHDINNNVLDTQALIFAV